MTDDKEYFMTELPVVLRTGECLNETKLNELHSVV